MGTAMTIFKQVSEDRYYDMLGAVPPRLMTGTAFLVGEAYDTRQCAITKLHCFTYEAFMERDDKFYEASEPMTVAEFQDMLSLNPSAGAA
jgi:hypothetical protein